MKYEKTDIESFGLKLLMGLIYAEETESKWIFTQVFTARKGKEAMKCFFMSCANGILPNAKVTPIDKVDMADVALMANVFGMAILGQEEKPPRNISDWIDKLIEDCQEDGLVEIDNRASMIWEQYKSQQRDFVELLNN